MMCRLLRQLFGKGRREALADETNRQTREEYANTQKTIQYHTAAAERLVRLLREDTTSWR